MLNVLVNRMFRTRFTDLCYGYNAFWTHHLAALQLDCTGFEIEALMNIRAAKIGLQIQEIPSHERPRISGASNLNAFRDGWRVLNVIVRERLLSTSKASVVPNNRPVVCALGSKDVSLPSVSRSELYDATNSFAVLTSDVVDELTFTVTGRSVPSFTVTLSPSTTFSNVFDVDASSTPPEPLEP